MKGFHKSTQSCNEAEKLTIILSSIVLCAAEIVCSLFSTYKELGSSQVRQQKMPSAVTISSALFLESQNHRIIQFGRDLERSANPIFLLKSRNSYKLSLDCLELQQVRS